MLPHVVIRVTTERDSRSDASSDNSPASPSITMSASKVSVELYCNVLFWVSAIIQQSNYSSESCPER